MFFIKWRNRNTLYVSSVTQGLSRYSSVDAAQRQIDLWSNIFKNNTYYIEPA